jgi:tRNA (guanine37-N1)-methyltransferase
MRIPFDIIGSRESSVAIITDAKLKNAKKAALEIMKKHKNVKSVLQKTGGRLTDYRLYDCRLLAGSKDTEVIHKEHGYMLKLDPQKAYFSPRESEERQRIAELAGDRERILVMFSGVAPYAVAIAKMHPKAEIVCLDINLDAIRYANKSVKLNKLVNIKNYCWDVRDAPGLGKFDRIIMPLPKGAESFLDVALAAAKKSTIIHFYDFEKEEDIPAKAALKVKTAAAAARKKIKILNVVKCGQLAPRAYRVCVDFKIL